MYCILVLGLGVDSAPLLLIACLGIALDTERYPLCKASLSRCECKSVLVIYTYTLRLLLLCMSTLVLCKLYIRLAMYVHAPITLQISVRPDHFYPKKMVRQDRFFHIYTQTKILVPSRMQPLGARILLWPVLHQGRECGLGSCSKQWDCEYWSFWICSIYLADSEGLHEFMNPILILLCYEEQLIVSWNSLPFILLCYEEQIIITSSV